MSRTINWNLGQTQSITLTENTSLVFINGLPGKEYQLILRVNGDYSASWPMAVIWPSGTEPTQTKSPANKDIFSFLYDGSCYHGIAYGQNYNLFCLPSPTPTITPTVTPTTTPTPLPITNPDALNYASQVIASDGTIDNTTALALDVLFDDVMFLILNS
jgi:hypothetical protein